MDRPNRKEIEREIDKVTREIQGTEGAAKGPQDDAVEARHQLGWGEHDVRYYGGESRFFD